MVGQMQYDAAVLARADGRARDALGLFAEALDAGPTTELRALIHQARARIESSDAPMRTYELLLTEAAAIGAADPQLAAAMLSDAARAALWAGDTELAAEASSSARQAALLAVEPIPARMYLFGLTFGSAPRERARDLRSALPKLLTGPGDPVQLHEHAAILLWLEEYATARRLLERAVRQARRRRLQCILPLALDTLAAVDFHTGRWAAAEGRSAEAHRLARELGEITQTASCLTTLAGVAAARGREQECQNHLFEARALVPEGHLVASYAASAAALLELGLSRPDAAILQLERLSVDSGERCATSPLVARWPPDLIEAYIRVGRLEEAGDVLRRFQRRAVQSSTRGALAAVARCRGLLAADDAFEREFERALRWHSRTPTPFERARTELCYGERLRRSQRRPKALVVLRSALETFERLGATPWAERAHRELATKHRGGRAKQSENGTGVLTSHEFQVATLVRRGATNREAARALSVTPKTIEYHLAGIYRKLNVRSRTQLADLLSRTSPSDVDSD